MHRSTCVFLLLISASVLGATSPGVAKDNQPHSQQQSGITWAKQAILALTGGNPVNSVTESGTVTRTVGGNLEEGTISIKSSGVMTSQITISTGAGNLSETRSWSDGTPSGRWTVLSDVQHSMAQQNCWTDAVWFFPALSLLSDYNDPTLVFVDLGPLQYSGGKVEHIQVYRYLPYVPNDVQQQIQRLSSVDYYLDSRTTLPVAMMFSSYGDQDATATIPMGFLFSHYQPVSGIQVPFQVTRLLNGGPSLEISLTSVVPN